MAQDILGQEPGPDNQEEQDRDPKPIGVPEKVRDPQTGEFVPFVVNIPKWQQGAQDIRAGIEPPTQEVAPRYFEGDHERLELFGINPQSTAGVINMQKALVAAGVLEPGEFEPGEWDDETANAMHKVLGRANRTGRSWDKQLDRMVTTAQPLEEEQEGGVAVDPFTPPSYDELAESARGTAEQIVGRELKDYEVELMAEKLLDFKKKAYENDIAISRARQEAQQEAAEAPAGEEVQAESVQGVQDPSLAFQAFAREHFEDEVARDEDVAESAQNFNLATRIFRSLGEV